MNPLTDRLTVLLVSDDPALLADEAGGRVPQVWRWDCINHPGQGCRADDGVHSRRDFIKRPCLVLVRDGVPVAMGIDRVRRLALDDNLPPRHVYGEGDAERAVAAHLRRYPGARVVLLRDGREVGS